MIKKRFVIASLFIGSFTLLTGCGAKNEKEPISESESNQVDNKKATFDPEVDTSDAVDNGEEVIIEEKK